jgi:hypothetical protein
MKSFRSMGSKIDYFELLVNYFRWYSVGDFLEIDSSYMRFLPEDFRPEPGRDVLKSVICRLDSIRLNEIGWFELSLDLFGRIEFMSEEIKKLYRGLENDREIVALRNEKVSVISESAAVLGAVSVAFNLNENSSSNLVCYKEYDLQLCAFNEIAQDDYVKKDFPIAKSIYDEVCNAMQTFETVGPLPCREEEFYKIEGFVKAILSSKRSCGSGVYLYGTPGTGKTGNEAS